MVTVDLRATVPSSPSFQMKLGNEGERLYIAVSLMFQDQIYQDYLRQLTLARELMLNEMMIKRTAGDDNGAISVLDSVCRRTIGIPLSLVRSTPPERLLELIRDVGQPNLNSILIAELLLQDVELSEKIDNIPQAIVSRLQAFCLLVDSIAFLGPEEQAQYRKKLGVLAADLKSISDDPYLRSKVDGYLSMKASG
jgi:hypothetical protein